MRLHDQCSMRVCCYQVSNTKTTPRTRPRKNLADVAHRSIVHFLSWFIILGKLLEPKLLMLSSGSHGDSARSSKCRNLNLKTFVDLVHGKTDLWKLCGRCDPCDNQFDR